MGIFSFGKPKDEKLDDEIAKKKAILKDLEEQINIMNYELEMSEYGLYKRKYKFSDSVKYKEALGSLRDKQKELIQSDKAGIKFTEMSLNNSVKKGKAMQNKLIKAMIRGFNGESDALLLKITVNNAEKKVEALERIFNQINNLYKANEIGISRKYLLLKQEELRLAAEYEMVREEEKEILREQRIKEREDKKLQQEIKEKRKQLEKDRKHFLQMIDNVEELMKNANDDEKERLALQLTEYQDKLSELNEVEEDIDYREGHATAGYVYIISNIGSFGDDVYKIGVTRRLEPLERISELSSASVPFRFDVHALIFSEDAYGLEAELHRELNEYRINKVNNRKEYFKVPFSEINKVLQNHKELSIELTEVAEALEYYQSIEGR